MTFLITKGMWYLHYFYITALAFHNKTSRVNNIPRHPPIDLHCNKKLFYSTTLFSCSPTTRQTFKCWARHCPESDRKLLERKSKVNGHEREKNLLCFRGGKDIELSVSTGDHAPLLWIPNTDPSSIHPLRCYYCYCWCPFHSDANLWVMDGWHLSSNIRGEGPWHCCRG